MADDKKTQRVPKLSREQIREGLEQIPLEGILYGAAASKAKEGKLTHKQREFARMLALGESKAGAYRETHNVREGSKRHRQRGYELAKRRDVQETVEAFKQAKQFADSHTPAQIRAFVIQQLVQHAADTEIKDATRVRCLELLGKVAEVGAFVDVKETRVIQSSQDIRAKLQDMLKQVGHGTTIHQNANDTADAASLMSELAPSPVENPESDTHPAPTPAFLGDIGAEDAHTIPHKQSSLSDDDPNISDGVLTATISSDKSDT